MSHEQDKLRWRVGTKVQRNLYWGNDPIAMLATEAMAQRLADGMNELTTLRESHRKLEQDLEREDGFFNELKALYKVKCEELEQARAEIERLANYASNATRILEMNGAQYHSSAMLLLKDLAKERRLKR